MVVFLVFNLYVIKIKDEVALRKHAPCNVGTHLLVFGLLTAIIKMIVFEHELVKECCSQSCAGLVGDFWFVLVVVDVIIL